MDHDAIRDQVLRLLQDLFELRWEKGEDPAALERLLAERQGIIDQLGQIDGSLAVVRKVIEKSPDLQDLHARIMDQDADLLRRSQERRDQLYDALKKTGEGRRAAQGYRLGLKPSPIMIDRSA